jgi:hypothetical protein
MTVRPPIVANSWVAISRLGAPMPLEMAPIGTAL